MNVMNWWILIEDERLKIANGDSRMNEEEGGEGGNEFSSYL